MKPKAMAVGALCAVLLLLNYVRDTRRTAASLTWTPVERKTVASTVNAPGVAQATLIEPVMSLVQEDVLKRMVQEGDVVKKGQILAELSQTTTQLDNQRILNAYKSARADLLKAQKEVRVQKFLFKSNAVPYKNVEDANDALKNRQAAEEIASREWDMSRKRLGSTKVIAPISGVVLEGLSEQRRRVSPGETLFVVGDVSMFSVKVKIDELEIQKIKTGQPVYIYLDAAPDKPVKGVVQFVASKANREAFAQIEVTIKILDPKSAPLKHNLSVRVEIVTENIPDALAVPNTAVVRRRDGAIVRVRGKHGGIEGRKVVLGLKSSRETQVVSGLREGESVGSPIETTTQ